MEDSAERQPASDVDDEEMASSPIAAQEDEEISSPVDHHSESEVERDRVESGSENEDAAHLEEQEGDRESGSEADIPKESDEDGANAHNSRESDSEAEEGQRDNSDVEETHRASDSEEVEANHREQRDSEADEKEDEVRQQSDLEESFSKTGYESDEKGKRSDVEGNASGDDNAAPDDDFAERHSEEGSNKGSNVEGEHSDREEKETETPLQPKKASDAEDESAEEEDSSEEESDREESKVGELIADIFGESDQDEEFEGFGEEDVAAAKRKKEQKRQKKKRRRIEVASGSEGEEEEEEQKVEKGEGEAPEDTVEEEPQQNAEKAKKESSDDSDDEDGSGKAHIVYDFDVMLQKKKEESGRRRKYRNVDIINDSDDLIADILSQMKVAADEDRELNKKRVAATKKLKMLPLVVSQMKKLDLKVAFLDQGALSIMNEWLMPLPDRSLPHLQIRTELLRLLAEFPPIDQGLLKTSGIGRAVMYLYKHPKETRDNKEKAGKLISEWSRPIFNLNTNFSSMSKEEREHRDFEHMPKKRKLRLEGGEENSEDINSAMTGDDKALKPGEKGWIGRARVPLPSTRDYVVRPKWNVDTELGKGSGQKGLTRLDKHIRNFKERKKQNKLQRAINISIEGRKMSL